MPDAREYDLSKELYELSREPYGATVEAILRKPLVMRLSHIKAAAQAVPDEDAQQRAIATTARQCLADATEDIPERITERQPLEADNPLAARFLLGIDVSIGRLRLKERLKRAAEAARMQVASMAKRGAESYEQRLMDELAAGLLRREWEYHQREEAASFDRSFVDEFLPSWMPPPLPDYRRAWFIADHLLRWLETGIECVGRKPTEAHKTACGRCVIPLASLARLAAITEEIDEPDHWGWLSKERFPARSALRQIQVASPFDPDRLAEAKQAVVGATSAADFATRLNKDSLMQWDAWLRRCKCGLKPKHPNPACGAHQVIRASADYAAADEKNPRPTTITKLTAGDAAAVLEMVNIERALKEPELPEPLAQMMGMFSPADWKGRHRAIAR
jgi:hypothetical protein